MKLDKIKLLTDDHYRLLFKADPSKRLIDDYTQRGTVFAALNPELVGIMVLLPTRPDTLELVNIAVDEAFQNQGYAQKMIAFAFDYARKQGIKTMEVGTGSTGFAQLYLYQKCGFRMTGIDKDFFIRHYDEEIIDNGQVLNDMVRLSLDL
ncbi:GNAT family N-acetyltransferase [Enterococcus sp. BWB1-3]|uniref:GNAT family N-acetyltransferase n=1 Tax=unclassified Enterococcus TaxID=2608891 RepID=UPI0019237747|nr:MULTISPECIES: GNAT family N-acetyltransferase [unclassified Enterococcus]MBL1227673.1 GNAT family N-acetyltransferase [Enterococcus sp. BWB1-3]MCB5952140.1 GNAT family N-acetyltransferase [Enterococcus sp. BWT-B8]MCB5954453.1 GNAT family N-acetyltransferase [Enterococcus sp. CWB-B31]